MLFACSGPHDAALAECPSVRAQCTPMGGVWVHTGEATLARAYCNFLSSHSLQWICQFMCITFLLATKLARVLHNAADHNLSASEMSINLSKSMNTCSSHWWDTDETFNSRRGSAPQSGWSVLAVGEQGVSGAVRGTWVWLVHNLGDCLGDMLLLGGILSDWKNSHWARARWAFRLVTAQNCY